MNDFDTPAIGTRVILKDDPIYQGRVTAVEGVGVDGVTAPMKIQVEWDDGYEGDNENPWWPLKDFHIPHKRHQQPADATTGGGNA